MCWFSQLSRKQCVAIVLTTFSCRLLLYAKYHLKNKMVTMPTQIQKLLKTLFGSRVVTRWHSKGPNALETRSLTQGLRGHRLQKTTSNEDRAFLHILSGNRLLSASMITVELVRRNERFVQNLLSTHIGYPCKFRNAPYLIDSVCPWCSVYIRQTLRIL